MECKVQIRPALGPGETYNDADFLLVHTNTNREGVSTTAIDRMFAAKREDDTGSWICKTISSQTIMSHEAALKEALTYADKHNVPIVYEEHNDERVIERLDWKAFATGTGY